jgi:hypothetical protein
MQEQEGQECVEEGPIDARSLPYFLRSARELFIPLF